MRHAADPELRRAAILIRPHPQNAAQWRDFDPSTFEAVGIWPRAGANPVDSDARADYFDSMFHSVAMVGINTSALIESGIVGRPVFTVLASEFAGQQEGTLHFQHLKNVNGGLLHVAPTMDEHLAQLAGAVRGGHDAAKSRAFVEAFVGRTGSTRRRRPNSSRRSRPRPRRPGPRRFAQASGHGSMPALPDPAGAAGAVPCQRPQGAATRRGDDRDASAAAAVRPGRSRVPRATTTRR